MAKLEYRKLSANEIEDGLGSLSGWSVEGDAIGKTFEFGRYQEGLVFATAVGLLADRLDHHPDLYIGYKKVKICLTTHATHGLSPYDFELASRIEGLGR